MDNLGIPALTEENEYENNYILDSDAENQDKEEQVPENEEDWDERKETFHEKIIKRNIYINTFRASTLTGLKIKIIYV